MATVIEAEGFVVRDSRGVVRARLGFVSEEQGYVGLSLYDREGRGRVLISTAGAGHYDRATVLIKDDRGVPRAKLDVVNGTCHLVLCDASEVPRVILACNPAGDTAVNVLNADGNVAFSTRQS